MTLATQHSTPFPRYGTMGVVTDRGSLLVARLHIDLALVSSAACRAQR